MRKARQDAIGASDHIAVCQPSGKQIAEDLGIGGRCYVELFGPDGELKDSREIPNLIVTTGTTAIIERLDSSPTTAQPSHMGLGTSGTAAAAGNTTLTGEPTRSALTSSVSALTVLTMIANWAAGSATGSWSEAGVFNALTTGTMYSRAVFTTIVKGAADTLQITWTYTLTAT
jgi:hypothetical protein